MKKVLSLLVLGSVAAGLLMSCNNTQTGTLSHNKEAVKNLQAATTLSLLSNTNFAKMMRANHAPTTEEIEDTKKVLPTIDMLLDNGINFESNITTSDTPVILFEDGQYDKDFTYTIKEEIGFLDNTNTKQTYSLYYNEAKVIENSEVEPDEEEHEKISFIKGWAQVGEEFYEFNSVTAEETEIEGNETETEFTRSFKIKTGDLSYILVEQENETEDEETEVEFNYKVVVGGKKTLDYSVEIEKKFDKTQIEYELDGKEYKVKRTEEEGKFVYKVKFENDDANTKAHMLFERATDTTEYIYIEK